MKSILRTVLAFAAACGAISLHAAPDRQRLADRLVTAEYVLEEVMANVETAIPSQVLDDALGIVLTINYRGGFFFGAQAGTGVLIAKNPLTRAWGPPAFVVTGGANLGLQFGVNEYNAIYIIMDKEILSRTISGRFDMGADAAAVAGPAYASSEARQGDEFRDAKILVYATKKGLFAGVAVKAGWVSPDKKSTKFFYNTNYNVPEIVLSDWFDVPPEANALMQRLKYYTDGGR